MMDPDERPDEEEAAPEPPPADTSTEQPADVLPVGQFDVTEFDNCVFAE